MLEVRDVRKTFGDLKVLDGISLDVEKGDVVAILGPSGSGKTTFLRCLNFLETADSGTMTFDGEAFDLHSAEMGMEKKQAEETAVRMLEKVGMSDKLKNYPSQLSGGQQQRVAIARAMASDPEIIYFDEPTSALDPELIGEVLTVMRKLAEDGMTMLVVTHEMDFARNVSSKVMFMEGGKVVETAPSKQFFEQPAEPRVRDFIRKVLASGE